MIGTSLPEDSIESLDLANTKSSFDMQMNRVGCLAVSLDLRCWLPKVAMGAR